MTHHKYYVKEKATGNWLADEFGTTLFCVDSENVTAERVLGDAALSLGVAEDTLEVVIDEEPNIADGVLKAEPAGVIPHPNDIATADSLKRMIAEYGSLEAALENL
tara:strand:- start:494 stop:811 length:318 start_codon:yes stop_codon:yes gene_type:complete